MKVKREHIALVGVLLLLLGIEMVVIQSIVLNSTVSGLIVKKFFPDKQFALMVKDSKGNVASRPIRVPIPAPVGHCVATGGFVLLLICFINVKE